MNKKKISIALYRLSDANLQVKAGHIIDSLTNNEYFTIPTPPLSEVRAALQDFSTAIAKAKDGSRYDVIIKKGKRKTQATKSWRSKGDAQPFQAKS